MNEIETIRVGSPFAIDPPPKPIDAVMVMPSGADPMAIADANSLRYTATGSIFAAALVIVFAAVSWWYFPAGGALIAGLGCVLSIFGMFSNYRLASLGLLAIHLCLFVANYGRMLS